MNDKQITALLKTNELLLNNLISVQLECQAIREMNILLLKTLVKLPEGNTPQAFYDLIIQIAKPKLESQMKQKLAEIQNQLV